MAVVLIPGFGGQFGQGFSGDVSVILFQAIQPDHEIMVLAFRQRYHLIFQFSQDDQRNQIAKDKSTFQAIIEGAQRIEMQAFPATRSRLSSVASAKEDGAGGPVLRRPCEGGSSGLLKAGRPSRMPTRERSAPTSAWP